jgi:hypothetical protein
MWRIPRVWPGETAWIVAGGPSVADLDTERLRGRKVIAINSSYQRVPFAPFVFFGDQRWWMQHRRNLAHWPGQIVTVAGVAHERVLRVRRYDLAVGLSLEDDGVVMGRTSLHAAINLAVLFGASRLAILGADMQPDPTGRTHHHSPHPWPQRPGCWDDQMAGLARIVEPLAKRGVEVLNVSPVSRIPWWPKVTLYEALACWPLTELTASSGPAAPST